MLDWSIAHLSTHLDTDDRAVPAATIGFVAQADAFDIAAVATQIDRPGAGSGAQHSASVDVLAPAIGEANVEIAQPERGVERTQPDLALASEARRVDPVAVTAIDAGIADGPPMPCSQRACWAAAGAIVVSVAGGGGKPEDEGRFMSFLLQ